MLSPTLSRFTDFREWHFDQIAESDRHLKSSIDKNYQLKPTQEAAQKYELFFFFWKTERKKYSFIVFWTLLWSLISFW